MVDHAGRRSLHAARPVSVKGVCAHRAGRAGRVLVCRNDRGEWELPGGRPEPGEPLADALVREVAEETGLEVVVGRALGRVALEVVPGRWVELVGFACTTRAGPLPVASELAVSDEHSAVAFLDPTRLPRDELPEPYRVLIDRSLRR